MTLPAGQKDSWRGAAAGPARRTNHPNPFNVDSSLVAFPSLSDEKEFLQPEGANLDEISHLRGPLLHDISHYTRLKRRMPSSWKKSTSR